MKKKQSFTLFLAFIGVAIALLLTFTIVSTPDTSAQKGSALVSGRLESGYEYVGFLISDQSKVCAATLLDPDTILTAGHCLAYTAGDEFYFGLGKFTIDTDKLTKVTLVSYTKGFDPKSATGPDIAIAKLKRRIDLDKFPQIGSPSENCDASIVAYGSGVDNAATVDLFAKKSGEGCVRAITESYLVKFGGDVGICFGDSGGPIFASRGSDQIVGILSGGLVDKQLNKLRCDPGNTGLAINLSKYDNSGDNFINFSSNTSDNFRIIESDSVEQLDFDLSKYVIDEANDDSQVVKTTNQIDLEVYDYRAEIFVLIVFGIATIVIIYIIVTKLK